MSRAQREVCAARLRPDDREMFLRLLARADESFHESVRVRRLAWALYRQAAGLPRREVKP
jgi:hypothetical protein